MIPAQCEVDWGAWATFFTGCAAVVAALVVGLRQSKIQELQADIASRVAATEEARIRLELFELRYAFVVALRNFVTRIHSSKDYWTVEDTKFLEESRRAEYLFPRGLKPIIDRIWDIGADYQTSTMNLNSNNKAEKIKAGQERSALRKDLDKAVKEFFDLCDRELRPFKD
ncbi:MULTISPECIES: hypothetical protein [unclassified Brevundimonas]|uniref:hypothetical protein n=1 Tax=unclassified Brevundimonas TaxID=2622653 RepID=UPI0025BE7B2A|nr:MULTISPECIES: hypothetical protein [unclassified Brevundimonas]